VRGWLWILVALTVATSIYRLGFQDHFGLNFETVLRLGVLQCASVAMLLAAYHPRHEQLYPGTAAVASALYGVALSVLVMQVIMEGGAETLSLLTVHTLATLVPGGLDVRARADRRVADSRGLRRRRLSRSSCVRRCSRTTRCSWRR
jgi:peptidoglycan/LPS O-acetylase OafA/YrhL